MLPVYQHPPTCLHFIFCTLHPLLSLSLTAAAPQVLLEWEEAEGRREWAHLKDSSKFQAVYVESKLLWAKRMVTMEHQRRAVAWPSKVRNNESLSSSLPHPLSSSLPLSFSLSLFHPPPVDTKQVTVLTVEWSIDL